MRPLRFDTQQWVIQPDTSPVSHHARHAITRRAFIGSMAVVAGATAGVGLIPVVARAAKPSSTAPVPTSVTQVIPGPKAVRWPASISNLAGHPSA